MTSNASEIASLAPSAAPAGPDPKLTKKHGEGCSVTYVNGTALPKARALVAFVIENETDEEQPVTATGIQATTLSGVATMADYEASKCTGLVPPRGKFACQVVYPTDARELRVRVEGAWFRIELEAFDGGKRP